MVRLYVESMAGRTSGKMPKAALAIRPMSRAHELKKDHRSRLFRLKYAMAQIPARANKGKRKPQGWPRKLALICDWTSQVAMWPGIARMKVATRKRRAVPRARVLSGSGTLTAM